MTKVLHQLGILLAVSSIIRAAPFNDPAMTSIARLFARDSSDCRSVQPSLPSEFVCNSTQNCISTDSASTVICCPKGNNCTQIAPITCDIQKQNVSASSASQILTTRLGDSLPSCSDGCCPFGFSCQEQGAGKPFCLMDLDKSSLNNTSPKTDTSTSSAAQSTQSPASNTIDSSMKSNEKSSFPPTVFLAGLAPGIALGILLTLAWVVCTKRNKKPQQQAKRHSDLSFADRPVISHPMPLDTGGRADFIRRAADRTKSVFSTRGGRQTQDSNPWNVKMPTPPVPNNVPDQIQGIPVTPVHQQFRKPSVETIQVFSPPSLVEHPSAAVRPLRRMSGQKRFSQSAALGHPFETPTKPAQGVQFQNDRNDGEVLTPQRYAAESRYSLDSRYEDKRDTTFTTMMRHAGMPDSGNQFPVPKIPAQYDSKNRI